MPNLAMRLPATQFCADGLDLAWPLGGEREVVAVPEEQLTLRIKLRIAEGSISIVDDKPTKEVNAQAREYRLLTGEEARKHMAEPAGPVTRVVYHPAASEEDKGHQLEVQTMQPESERFIAAQVAAAEAAEAAHAAVTERQVAAEAAAEAEPKPEAEPDPLAERLNRTTEASEAWAAAAEKAAAEREAKRQKLEDAELKHFEKRAKILAASSVEPDSSAYDEGVMAREKVRQKAEAKLEKERSKAAADALAEAEKTPSVGYAGKSDPYIGMSDVGARADAGTTVAQGGVQRPKAQRSSEEDRAAAKPAEKATKSDKE